MLANVGAEPANPTKEMRRACLTLLQQSGVLKDAGLSVGQYHSDSIKTCFRTQQWREAIDRHTVLVMTPEILMHALAHAHLSVGHTATCLFYHHIML